MRIAVLALCATSCAAPGASSDESSGSPVSTNGCPGDKSPPDEVVEVDLYEADAVYDAPSNSMEMYLVNPTDSVHGFYAFGFLTPETHEALVVGENKRCLSPTQMRGASVEGEYIDGELVYSGLAIVTMERLSEGSGCGTVVFEDVVVGPTGLDFAVRVSGPGTLECQGEGTPDSGGE